MSTIKKKKINKDREDFYDCHTQKLQKELQDLKKEIENLGNQLDVDRCWYAIKSKAKGIQAKLKPTAEKFKEIVPYVKKHLKSILISYHQSFGNPSSLLHPKEIIEQKLITQSDYKKYIGGNLLLALHIISLITDILHLHNSQEDSIKKINHAIKNNLLSKEIFKLATNPRISTGDFVKTPGGLAEVIKETKSKYDYRAFHVKHLLPDSSGIKTEQYIPEEIRLFKSKREMTKRVVQILKQYQKPNTKISSQKINKTIKELIIETWTLMESILGIHKNKL